MAKTKTATKTSPKKRSTSATPKKAATTAKKSAKKKAPAKKKKAAKPAGDKPAGEMEATIDRRRPASMRAAENADASSDGAPKLERRKKVNRRRQIDPTTCERDYSDAEVEFMGALDEYKRKNGRMFPTCSEVLEVIRSLGYVQLSAAEIAARAPAEPEATDDLEQQAEAEALGAQADSESLQVETETEIESPVA